MAGSSRRHAALASHHGDYNPRSVYRLAPKPRLQEVAQLLEHLFGAAHTHVAVRMADGKNPDAPISLCVHVDAGGEVDATNERIALCLLLRNALNAHSLEARRPDAGGGARRASAGKQRQAAQRQAPALVLTGTTTLARIAGAERRFLRRRRCWAALEAGVVAAVTSAAWAGLVGCWRLAFGA